MGTLEQGLDKREVDITRIPDENETEHGRNKQGHHKLTRLLSEPQFVFLLSHPVTAGLAVEFWAGELSSKLLVFKSQLKERESNLKVRSRKHINVSASFTVLSLFCQILSHSTSLTQNIMCRLSRWYGSSLRGLSPYLLWFRDFSCSTSRNFFLSVFVKTDYSDLVGHRTWAILNLYWRTLHYQKALDVYFSVHKLARRSTLGKAVKFGRLWSCHQCKGPCILRRPTSTCSQA